MNGHELNRSSSYSVKNIMYGNKRRHKLDRFRLVGYRRIPKDTETCRARSQLPPISKPPLPLHQLIYTTLKTMMHPHRVLAVLLILPTALGFLSPSLNTPPSSKVALFNHANNNNEVDRRSAVRVGGLTLASLLLPLAANTNPAEAAERYNDDPKQRILITGSNSGIGLDAAQRLALRGHEVVLACVSVVDGI